MKRTVKNPILMKVNPPGGEIDLDEVEMLWVQAKKMKPNLKKDEFFEAIVQFHQQHHKLPKELVLRDEPTLSEKIKIATLVGKVPHVLYEAPVYSRKSKNGERYIHPTKSTYLYATTDGMTFMISDEMRLEEDGWLHD